LLSGCSNGGEIGGGGPLISLVSITVSPPIPDIPTGISIQFTATGYYSDGTSRDITTTAIWTSSDTSVATVTATRVLVAGASLGITTIRALSDAVSGSANLIVTSATLVSIAVTPSAPTIANGTTQQFTCMATYSNNSSQDVTTSATWNSVDPLIVTIGLNTGLATPVAVGVTTITADYSGKSHSTGITITPAALVSISVTPPSPSVLFGATRQFAATGNYSDGSTLDIMILATWGPLTPANAAVSNTAGSKGLASAVGGGSATITADYGGEQGTALLTVTNAALTSIVVTPANASIPIGSTRQFTATGSFNDATTQDITPSVTWASTNSGIASISNISGSQGLATAVSVGGPVNITATGIPPLASTVGTTPLTVIQPTNAYVTNFDGDSVSVIDTVSDTVVGVPIPVGFRPSGIAVDLAANRAYVANSGDNTVSVIDIIFNTVVNTITVGSGPEGVAVHPTANSVYVANNGGNTVSVINTVTDTLLTTFSSGVFTPRGIVVYPALSRIYVANSASHYVAVMTVEGSPLVYPAVGTGPISMAIDLSSSPAKVYVGNTGAGTISVIRTDNNAIDGTITVGSYPYGIGIQTASGKAYGAIFLDDTVSVINTTTKTIITTIPGLNGPYGVAVP
jgi:trimeric autotransporter adhesin